MAKDAWQGRAKEMSKKTYTPSFKGTPVKKPTSTYKNLTNVAGKTSPKRRSNKKFNQSAYTRAHKSVFGL